MTLRVVVVGAGLAGLAAAIALHRAGHHVKVRKDPLSKSGLIKNQNTDMILVLGYRTVRISQ